MTTNLKSINLHTTLLASTIDSAIVGEVCLYGGRECGYDYIAAWVGTGDDGRPAVRQTGDGDPTRMAPGNRWSATEAVWAALGELGDRVSGKVAVYASGGEQVAIVESTWRGYYGDLAWQPSPMLNLSMDDLIAMSDVRGHCPCVSDDEADDAFSHGEARAARAQYARENPRAWFNAERFA